MSLPHPQERAKLSSFENHCHNCGNKAAISGLTHPPFLDVLGGVDGIGEAGENSFCPQEESNPPLSRALERHC